MINQDSEEYRKWKHGSNEAEAKLKQLNCPRGCGKSDYLPDWKLHERSSAIPQELRHRL